MSDAHAAAVGAGDHGHAPGRARDLRLDLSPFYQDTFDAQVYASQFLGDSVLQSLKGTAGNAQNAGESVQRDNVSAHVASVDSDMRVALSRLSMSINQVDQNIHELVAAHPDAFLARVASVEKLQGAMRTIQEQVAHLEQQAASARDLVRVPLENIRASEAHLVRVQNAEDVAALAQAAVAASHRLESHMDAVMRSDLQASMSDPREMHESIAHVVSASAAVQSLGARSSAPCLPAEELVCARDARGATACASVRRLGVLEPHMELLPDAVHLLVERIETVLLCGLRSLSPAMLGSAVQAAHHLRRLDAVVGRLMQDLQGVLADHTTTAMDLIALGKDLGEPLLPTLPSGAAPLYKTRNGAASAPAEKLAKWVDGACARLHALVVDELAPIYAKVHMLEQVLRLRTDEHGTPYAELIEAHLSGLPTELLWTAFAREFTAVCAENIQESGFWRHLLVLSFPRLRALFHELFARLALLTERSGCLASYAPAPVVEMLATFESQYLASVEQRLIHAQRDLCAVLAKGKPGTQEAARLAEIMETELQANSADPAHATVQELCGTVVEALLRQVMCLIRHDDGAFSLQHAQATAAQLQNAHIASALNTLRSGLLRMEREGLGALLAEKAVQTVLYTHIHAPLVTSVKREMATVLARIYRFKVERATVTTSADTGDADTSAYMLELCARLAFLRTQFFGRYAGGVESGQSALDVARHVLTVFVAHASLIRLDHESEKLQLVSDMTALELSLSQLLYEVGHSGAGNALTLTDCGDAFVAIRGFRTLLFLPTDDFADPAKVRRRTAPMSDMFLLHHLVSRSKLVPLPNELRRMNKTAYVEWIISTSQAHGALVSTRVEGEVLHDMRAWVQHHAAEVDAQVSSDSTPHSEDRRVLRCLEVWQAA
ncbi:hypothetical protein MSPP1_003434 [Malassezia sp. CBS 17886]|nr:hypothetical protein MSPP1_003434 [Malassezia sp. CBS 17886]